LLEDLRTLKNISRFFSNNSLAALVALGFSLAIDTAAAQQAANNQRAQNSAMQEMMKRMMPGEGHKALADMTGKWIGTMKMWNSTIPTSPPIESTTQSETKLILGGRFALTDSVGTLMGRPFQHMGILGYDNATKLYTQIFYSNMGTATNVATGTATDDGRTLTLRGEFDEPEGKVPFKNVVRMESDDLHIFESYRIMPDGRELKLIEETNTRVK
jgi:hypothetical protein